MPLPLWPFALRLPLSPCPTALQVLVLRFSGSLGAALPAHRHVGVAADSAGAEKVPFYERGAGRLVCPGRLLALCRYRAG